MTNKAKEEYQRQHTFEFEVNLFTDHPKFRDKLSRGKHNLVTYNGNSVGSCLRCVTGRDGWAEVPVFSRVSSEPIGSKIIQGNIKYFDLRENIEDK